MPRPIKAVIKLEALRQNLNLAVKLASPGKVMAVVKADAYGHGLSRLLPALGAADALALLEIEGQGL